MLNPYLGHRMETVHQNELPMVCASLFRHVLCGNASHTFTIEQYPNLTPMCKYSHSLTEQNLSFQNWPKKWSLVHGTRLEGHPSTISISWIKQSQWFVNPSNGHDSMACWIPPPTGFQRHLLNPYSGHRMETVHQKGLPMGHASIFRHVLCGNSSHTFMVEQYANLTPMCRNLTFTYWAKP